MQFFYLFILLIFYVGNGLAVELPGSVANNGQQINQQDQAMQDLSASEAGTLISSQNQLEQKINSATNNATTTESNKQFITNSDYKSNLDSDVFGAQLFSGSFAQAGVTRFHPDYVIAVGDQVQIKLWGGFNFDSLLVVDPQGNIFLPQIGPVKLLGVHNSELHTVITNAIKKVFLNNVYSYASLAEAKPMRIFVGGFVKRPGLYDGTSMDSLLHYLDAAGGIDPERGSFLNVEIKRAGQVRAKVNLYDFLLHGRINLIQLGAGDVIFVPARQALVKANGLVESAKYFEFEDSIDINELSQLARPLPTATHVRITRNTGLVKNIDYLPLEQAQTVKLNNGDTVEFTADKKPGSITVRVEGEHLSSQEYVLPQGAKIGALLKKIQLSKAADLSSVQLFRQSIKERQKAMLQTSLKSLESSVLTAQSGTNDEASLRKEEANLILQWVDKAKNIEPKGQVFIAKSANLDELLLENGDILRIPAEDDLVLVSGEVLFPNAILYDPNLSLTDYIERSGGFVQGENNARIIVAHRDGSFDDAEEIHQLQTGDQVLVLPKVDVKSGQMWKDITEIIFQIAIAASVVLLL